VLTSAGAVEVTVPLTETWQAEQRTFAARDLSQVDYVYLWTDGIHVNIRLAEHKLCLLVMIGVRADGRKELIKAAASVPASSAHSSTRPGGKAKTSSLTCPPSTAAPQVVWIATVNPASARQIALVSPLTPAPQRVASV
jgi:transposase-like protein